MLKQSSAMTPASAAQNAVISKSDTVIRDQAIKIVARLAQIGPIDGVDFTTRLKPINFLVHNLTKTDPTFLSILVEIASKENKEGTNPLEVIFKLGCLSDGSLPDIHVCIQKHMNLKTLQYYLPNHLSQLKTLIDTNILRQIIINSIIIPTDTHLRDTHRDLTNLSHLLRIISLI